MQKAIVLFLLASSIAPLGAQRIGSSAYGLIQSAGSPLSRRQKLNFVSGVTCVDNAGTGATDCTGASAGVTSLQTLTGALTLALDTAGTAPAWTPSGSTITLSLPDASATARGLITTGTQTIAGTKTFSSAPTMTNGLAVGSSVYSLTTSGIDSSFSASSSGSILQVRWLSSRTFTAGTAAVIIAKLDASPTSGSAILQGIRMDGTLNITSTSTATSTGIYIVPTLTSIHTHRHIWVPNNTATILTTVATDPEAYYFGRITYNAGSSKTFTNAYTMHISGPPVAGTNVTITNPMALWVEAGLVYTQGYRRNGAVATLSLPTCNASTQDWEATVTDATAPTYGAVLVGGGGVRTPVFCDGTNWITR